VSNRKTWPIKADCSQCGHEGEIFVDDELLAKTVNGYIKSRADRAWGALCVRRVLILLGVVFALGALAGRFLWR
jgi:hypothetical protein